MSTGFVVCAQCQAQIRPEDQFCPQCGTANPQWTDSDRSAAADEPVVDLAALFGEADSAEAAPVSTAAPAQAEIDLSALFGVPDSNETPQESEAVEQAEIQTAAPQSPVLTGPLAEVPGQQESPLTEGSTVHDVHDEPLIDAETTVVPAQGQVTMAEGAQQVAVEPTGPAGTALSEPAEATVAESTATVADSGAEPPHELLRDWNGKEASLHLAGTAPASEEPQAIAPAVEPSTELDTGSTVQQESDPQIGTNAELTGQSASIPEPSATDEQTGESAEVTSERPEEASSGPQSMPDEEAIVAQPEYLAPSAIEHPVAHEGADEAALDATPVDLQPVLPVSEVQPEPALENAAPSLLGPPAFAAPVPLELEPEPEDAVGREPAQVEELAASPEEAAEPYSESTQAVEQPLEIMPVQRTDEDPEISTLRPEETVTGMEPVAALEAPDQEVQNAEPPAVTQVEETLAFQPIASEAVVVDSEPAASIEPVEPTADLSADAAHLQTIDQDTLTEQSSIAEEGFIAEPAGLVEGSPEAVSLQAEPAPANPQAGSLQIDGAAEVEQSMTAGETAAAHDITFEAPAEVPSPEQEAVESTTAEEQPALATQPVQTPEEETVGVLVPETVHDELLSKADLGVASRPENPIVADEIEAPAAESGEVGDQPVETAPIAAEESNPAPPTEEPTSEEPPATRDLTPETGAAFPVIENTEAPVAAVVQEQEIIAPVAGEPLVAEPAAVEAVSQEEQLAESVPPTSVLEVEDSTTEEPANAGASEAASEAPVELVREEEPLPRPGHETGPTATAESFPRDEPVRILDAAAPLQQATAADMQGTEPLTAGPVVSATGESEGLAPGSSAFGESDRPASYIEPQATAEDIAEPVAMLAETAPETVEPASEPAVVLDSDLPVSAEPMRSTVLSPEPEAALEGSGQQIAEPGEPREQIAPVPVPEEPFESGGEMVPVPVPTEVPPAVASSGLDEAHSVPVEPVPQEAPTRPLEEAAPSTGLETSFPSERASEEPAALADEPGGARPGEVAAVGEATMQTADSQAQVQESQAQQASPATTSEIDLSALFDQIEVAPPSVGSATPAVEPAGVVGSEEGAPAGPAIPEFVPEVESPTDAPVVLYTVQESAPAIPEPVAEETEPAPPSLPEQTPAWWSGQPTQSQVEQQIAPEPETPSAPIVYSYPQTGPTPYSAAPGGSFGTPQWPPVQPSVPWSGTSKPQPGTPEYEEMARQIMAQRQQGATSYPSNQPPTPTQPPVQPPAWTPPPATNPYAAQPAGARPQPGTPEYEEMARRALEQQGIRPSPDPSPYQAPPTYAQPPAWGSSTRPQPGTPEYEEMARQAMSQHPGGQPTPTGSTQTNQAQPPGGQGQWTPPGQPRPQPGTPEYEEMARRALNERLGFSDRDQQ